MALIRSLNTAVSGLKAQQLRIEVVGNNIANVDTTGFKSARTDFSTILSEVQSYGMAPDGFLGGIDPTQVGLGAVGGPTTKNFEQGPVKDTGVNSDLAIQGDGFFILRDTTGNVAYSRDGSFSLNPSNYLHDPTSGSVVQGWMADSSFSVSPGGPIADIEIPVGVRTIAQATSRATLEGNLNASGAVASSGTRIFSEDLYDASRADGDLISASNPLGLQRATSTSRLQDLVRSLNDQTGFTGSSAGTAGSFTYVFPDLQTSAAGLQIQVSADKGGRTLEADPFVVGSLPPVGGTTLGELLDYIQGGLGITDGTLDGTRSIQHAYSFVRRNPATGLEVSGMIGAGDTVGLTSITRSGGDLRGVEVGDFIRFSSGDASGEVAEIVGLSDSDGDGFPDTMALRNDGFDSLAKVPSVGDSWSIEAPAGARVAGEETLMTLSGATVGTPATSGAVTSFTVTDASHPDLAGELGLAANDIVEYLSGGTLVRGVVSAVSGDTATIAFRSSQSRAPDAGTDFTFLSPAAGGFEIAGNVGEANGIENIQLTAGGSLIPIFDAQPAETAVGESVTTTIVGYDSLGTPREVNLTFVHESSSANGPNVFRFFAESAEDSDRSRIIGSGTVLFDSQGQFLTIGEGDGTVSIDLAADPTRAGGVVTPFSFKLDFSRLTQFTDGSQVVMRDQDGFGTGTLRNYTVNTDGTVVGVFDNGLTRTIAQVALARFANANGLLDAGNNSFVESTNSGVAQIGAAGTFGRGTIRGASLEESNVDLAEQFTQLMVGQRAFQANARTVSTTDQLLQELVNML